MNAMYSAKNRRLFVGGIPKRCQKDEIFHEMEKLVEGVCDVILYPSPTDKTKNRGFAFVEFDHHSQASEAFGKVRRLFGTAVELNWADPVPIVPVEVMEKVRALHVSGLMATTTEAAIAGHFNKRNPGGLEFVNKPRPGFAFVQFWERRCALDSLAALNGSVLDGAVLHVALAKPRFALERPEDGTVEEQVDALRVLQEEVKADEIALAKKKAFMRAAARRLNRVCPKAALVSKRLDIGEELFEILEDVEDEKKECEAVLARMVIEVTERGAQAKLLRVGGREAAAAVVRGEAGMVVVAEDAAMPQLVVDVRELCDQYGVRCLAVKAKADLGRACGAANSVIAVAIAMDASSPLKAQLSRVLAEDHRLRRDY